MFWQIFALPYSFLYNRTAPNLSYFGNLGSLAFFFCCVQIISGIFLASWYIPEIDLCFSSIQYIMLETHFGWFFRYMHVTGASFFFFFVYLHLFKNLYYGSFLFPKQWVWFTGCIILVLMMIIAFFGYILPWGNMSFWATVVVTNVLHVFGSVGSYLSIWLLGNSLLCQHTLSKFFTLHFLLPFVLLFFLFFHLLFLHISGSTNLLGLKFGWDLISFSPYYLNKDLLGFFIFFFLQLFIIFFYPNIFMHAENFEEANNQKTPLHIVPEWYFLPFYGILRSTPDKFMGILLVILVFVVLFILPMLGAFFIRIQHTKFQIIYKIYFFFCSYNFLNLGIFGGKPLVGKNIAMLSFNVFFLFFNFGYLYFFLFFFNKFIFGTHKLKAALDDILDNAQISEKNDFLILLKKNGNINLYDYLISFLEFLDMLNNNPNPEDLENILLRLNSYDNTFITFKNFVFLQEGYSVSHYKFVFFEQYFFAPEFLSFLMYYILLDDKK